MWNVSDTGAGFVDAYQYDMGKGDWRYFFFFFKRTEAILCNLRRSNTGKCTCGLYCKLCIRNVLLLAGINNKLLHFSVFSVIKLKTTRG